MIMSLRPSFGSSPLTIADSSSKMSESKSKEEPSENPLFPCGGPTSIQKGSGNRYVLGPSGVKWNLLPLPDSVMKLAMCSQVTPR